MAGSKRTIGRFVLSVAFAAGEPVHCEYCGHQVWRHHGAHVNGMLAVADHRIPLSRGGRDVADNIAIACKRCDHEKGPLTGDEFVRLRTNHEERKKLIAFVLLSISNRDLRVMHVNADRLASKRASLARRNEYRARRRAG